MFTFKQFAIRQDRCAQKVSEMACIFGAWIELPESASSVLDIGSGTGLLSLMLAQRYSVQIDAIELEASCFLQGKENVMASPFHTRIHCMQGDIRSYRTDSRYDAIITNPPFFEGQLRAGSHERILARHADTLTLDDLLQAMKALLTPTGRFSVLFPYARMQEVLDRCQEAGYHALRTLSVRHSHAHAPNVWMCEFSGKPSETVHETLVVKEDGQYTPGMKALVKAYYLYE